MLQENGFDPKRGREKVVLAVAYDKNDQSLAETFILLQEQVC